MRSEASETNDPSSRLVVASGVPLCWRSPQSLDGLAQSLAAALAAWSDDWSVEVGNVECRNAWETGVELDALAWHRVASVGDAMLRVASAGDGIVESVAQLLFAAPLPADRAKAPLARALAAQAVTALEATLAGALAAQAALSTPCDGPRPPRAWSGDVVATCDLGPERLVLHIDAALLPATRSKVRTPPAPRRALDEVLADRSLSLRAVLADTDMALHDLVGLQPGDVLVTSHRLNDPLALLSQQADGRRVPVFAGNLARSGSRMAVALAAATATDRTPSSAS